jgi:hypothetical protein
VLRVRQSAVLRCRWASLTRILKAKEALIQKSAPGSEFKPPCMFAIGHLYLKSERS